jgi:hypothetical protein
MIAAVIASCIDAREDTCGQFEALFDLHGFTSYRCCWEEIGAVHAADVHERLRNTAPTLAVNSSSRDDSGVMAGNSTLQANVRRLASRMIRTCGSC